MRKLTATLLTGALVLAGCGKKAPTLPTTPVDQAAACSAIQVATEQEAVGATGHLSAEAQERVLHYALLAASGKGRFDDAIGNAVIKRTTGIFAETVKGDWRTLRPACAAAYPAAARATPALPDKPDERALQCYALVEFMRKALGQYEGRYADATVAMGVTADKLDARVSPVVKREHLEGEALAERKSRALAAAAGLGSPPAVLAACGKEYG